MPVRASAAGAAGPRPASGRRSPAAGARGRAGRSRCPTTVSGAVDAAQRRRHAAAAAADVEQAHGLGERDVGVRVEAAGQLVRVVVEVGLDGEAAPRRRGPRRPAGRGRTAGRARSRSGRSGARSGGRCPCRRAGPARRARRSSRRRGRRDRPSIAAICAAWVPIWSAVTAAVDPSTSPPRTRSGWRTSHSSTRMPPSDGPSMSAHESMPRSSVRRRSTSTMSPTVTTGKRLPHGRPSGASDDGPVVPWQPPSTLAHTTNHSSVSTGTPGPTSRATSRRCDDPDPPGPATCESPVSAWQT